MLRPGEAAGYDEMIFSPNPRGADLVLREREADERHLLEECRDIVEAELQLVKAIGVDIHLTVGRIVEVLDEPALGIEALVYGGGGVLDIAARLVRPLGLGGPPGIGGNRGPPVAGPPRTVGRA